MKKNIKGFTLIELLVVIGIIAILAAIVIIAINPGYQFAQARNAQRWSNVNTIINAVHQYMVSTKGQLPKPESLGATPIEICKTVHTDCSGLIDLSPELTTKFIVEIPIDPACASSGNSTCYTIASSTDDRIIITAPKAELGETIRITR